MVLSGPDHRMVKMIRKHHLLTLATMSGSRIWTASCFYAYWEEGNALIFTTDPDTLHGKQMMEQPRVAFNIALETKVIGKIQGIQGDGSVFPAEGEHYDEIRKIYLRRFPMASLFNTTLWYLEFNYLKMTDNRLGFGTKLHWGNRDGDDSKSER